VQYFTEKILNDWLNNNFYLWDTRPEIRGQLFTQLYLLRNNVFNINPTSKRKIIKNRYNDNTLALEEIYSAGNKSGIKIFSYILPIRNDVEPPYDLKEYEGFKTFLDSLNNSTNNILFNFESIVPAEYWGTKDATTFGDEREIDFMHFQAAGHKILADSLWQRLSIYNNWNLP
jgi:lysophospholipase L1-like esterase